MSGWRTHTRPNNIPGEREHVWGWDAISGLVAVVGLLVTILIFMITDRISIEHRLSEPRLLTVKDKAEIGEIVTKSIKEADAEFIKKEEIEQMLATQLAGVHGELSLVNLRLKNLEDGDRYNRRVLSSIDLKSGGAK